MEIKVVVEETEVEGEIVHRSAGDITVKIVKPYQNLSTGLHIPYFGRPYRSFDGDYGDAVAESLLNDLYHIGRHLELEMEKLREKLWQAKDKISHLQLSFRNEEFKGKKSELKKLLKEGKLGKKAYQEELKSLRKKLEEFNWRVHAIMDSFFDENFPMCIPHGTRGEVLEAIEAGGFFHD